MTQQGRCRGARSWKAHASDAHAQVFCLDHDPRPARAEVAGQPLGHVVRQAFLDLRAGGEVLDQADQFGLADDAVAGQATDMREPAERQQVMFTQGAVNSMSLTSTNSW